MSLPGDICGDSTQEHLNRRNRSAQHGSPQPDGAAALALKASLGEALGYLRFRISNAAGQQGISKIV